MGDPIAGNPNPSPPALPPPCSNGNGGGEVGGAVGVGSRWVFPRPAMRVTSEFDSESSVWFHKVSCRFFDRLAKVKLSFQNDGKGELSSPQLGFITRHLAVLYDIESRNALLKGSVGISDRFQLRATHDVKSILLGEPNYVHVGCSRKYLSFSCTFENNKSIVSRVYLDRVFLIRCQFRKEQQGEVAMVLNLANPSYKLELASSVPVDGLPRATLRFPLGEVSVGEKETEEAKRVLSMNGILKGQLLNGVCTALYKDDDLNLRYIYKDEEMSFIPSISLPSNATSFAFKRRFSPSDKFSYWYHFDSNEWNAVYKHTIGKELKFKAGYDSEVRLGWASLWAGDEDGKTTTAPMKVKAQFMLQVPQDDFRKSDFMFRVKKRWDF